MNIKDLKNTPPKNILLILIFAITFAFVESSVVVYLRMLYYPEGFSFPLKAMSANVLTIELLRELSTIVMLLSIGILVGKTRWEKFSYFLIAFGTWDIFYYVWLKVLLNWPRSIFDWDILFLIPLPWIGPVIVPVLISLVLIISGVMILKTEIFQPSIISWIAVIAGSIVILYSFICDTNATLKFQLPLPFRYELFGIGMTFYIAALYLTFLKTANSKL